MKVLPLVRVKWRDACSHTRWCDLDDMAELEPIPCITVGYLLKQTPDKVIIVPTINELDEGTDSMTIPAPWVMEILEVTDAQGVDGWSGKEGC